MASILSHVVKYSLYMKKEEITSVPGRWGNLEIEFELSLEYWETFQWVWWDVIHVSLSPTQTL